MLCRHVFPVVMSFVFGLSDAHCLADGGLSEEEKGQGFVSLFNGEDFTNWRFDNDSPPKKLPDNWKVEGGVMKLSGGGKPHLASAKEYGNFEWRFEWRSLRDKYNSGVYIRSGKAIGANQLNLAKGSEGKLINGKLDGSKAVPDLQKPAGEWNEWRITVVDDKVTLICNGQKAFDGTGFAPASGYIGIQAEGAPLELRNLRIREIK